MEPADINYYAQSVLALHENWEPHEGQIAVGRKLFNDDIRRIFIQCGRKWGKTEFVLYCLWRYAQFNPGATCYYISPFYKQSKEIIWANRRIQNFGPREWLKDGSQGINNSELRINFKNDSFIKLDGSDNHQAYRGINPHLIVYEEFKDFRPEFHEAMNPNLAVYKAPLVIIGTPPEREGIYTDLAIEMKNDPMAFFYKAPTWQNPHISPEWLGQEKARLFKKGEHDVWYREYAADFVIGGNNSIFPMWNRSLIMKHDDLIKELRCDWSKLQFGVVADPGTASVTALLYYAYNPYNSKFYLIDEIYEKDPRQNTVNKIGEQHIGKKNELNKRAEWYQNCDEAAAWFISEMIDRFDESFMPTEKSLNKKEHGLSLIKDMMLGEFLVVSDRCKNLVWETENYVKDKNGRIPKKDDHLLDCFRYALAAVGYTLNEDSIEGSRIDRVAQEHGRMIRLENEVIVGNDKFEDLELFDEYELF